MLYLLNKDVRTVRWNGEPLHESTSAIVKETMNGDFTLTVKYPISDSGIYQLIQEDMLIKAPTPVLGAQLFRIKKPVEHNDHLEITAYHISDDVMQRSITPVSVTSQSCGMALSRMVQNTKTSLGDFSFNSDIQDRRTFNMTETETLYSVLLDGKHSIVGTWEGELVRDNFAMTIKKSRGENRGVVITTHKNLKDYQRTKNSQNVVTRIHAKSTFKPEGAEKETTIRVTVDSPLINSYPYINEKEYENNNAKSAEELQKWAQAKFSNEGIDKVSDAIKIEAYELDGQVVHMGDTVNLKSWKHNVDVFKKAIAYEFDALKEEYISLTFDDKAGAGGSRASGGLSSAADAILGVTESAQEIALEKALQNADLDFDHQAGLLRQEILDGIELARAKAEEVKRELSDTINQRFDNFDNASIQEAKRRAEEALRNAGASSLLAQEAKRISLDSIAKLEAFKSQATSAQTALSGDLDALKRTVTSEVNQASEYRRTTTEALSRMTGQMNGFATKSEVRQDVAGLTETFAKLKTDTNNLISGAKSEITLAKTEFKKTADGLSAKMSAVESYVGQDGQRQEALRRYTREESARQATAVREQISKDYVGKNTFQESVQGVERRLESLSLGTSGNLLKNSNDGFRNQNDKKYRLVETLQANQTYTLVSKYWNGENATGHTFLDGIGNWRHLTYNSAIDAWMVQFTPTKKIPAGTEITLSSDPGGSVGNMSWATLVRGAIPLIHWQPAKGDVEEGVTQKLAEYKETVDGRFATISSQINGKVNQADFQRVKETSQLYERIIGSNENDISNKVARMALTNQLFQVEVSKNEGLKTVQRQLAGSWSVQNINSAGDLISGINLGANGHNRFVGKLTHITGESLIDKAVIKSAMVDKLKTANFEAGSVTTTILDAEAVTADKVRMDQAFANKLVASNIFTDTLAAKEAFINKLRSVVVSATLLEGYKGKIGGFQIGTHEKDSSVYWITGQNQFSVGMSNGSGQWNQTALWVNWGNNWGKPNDTAWFVKHTGQMYCYNRAEFWNTPIIHGDLMVTGSIYFNNKAEGGRAGHWVYSEKYSKIEPENGYLYLYYSGSGYNWIPMNKEISDRRYKHNIEDSTVSGLDIINNLKTYSYRKEYDGKTTDISCGIMAQDVQKYIPEAFWKNPDGAYSYRTFELVPYLIKAIQELNQKLEEIA